MDFSEFVKRRPRTSTTADASTSSSTRNRATLTTTAPPMTVVAPTTIVTPTTIVSPVLVTTTIRRGTRKITQVVTQSASTETREVTTIQQNTITITSQLPGATPAVNAGTGTNGGNGVNIVVAIITPNAPSTITSTASSSASGSGSGSASGAQNSPASSGVALAQATSGAASDIDVAPTGSATASAFCALFATTPCIGQTVLPASMATAATAVASNNSTAQAANNESSFSASLRNSPATIIATILVAIIAAGLLAALIAWGVRRCHRQRSRRRTKLVDPWLSEKGGKVGLISSSHIPTPILIPPHQRDMRDIRGRISKPYNYSHGAHGDSTEALSPSGGDGPVSVTRNANVYGIGPENPMTQSMVDLSTPLAATQPHQPGSMYPFPPQSTTDLSHYSDPYNDLQVAADVPISPTTRSVSTFTPMDAVDPNEEPNSAAYAANGMRVGSALYPIAEVDSRRPSGNEAAGMETNYSPSVGVALGTPSIVQSANPSPNGSNGGVSPYWDGPFIFDRPRSALSDSHSSRLSQGAHPSLANVGVYPSPNTSVHPLKREFSYSSCVSHWSSSGSGGSPRNAPDTTSLETREFPGALAPPSRGSSLHPKAASSAGHDSFSDPTSSVPSVVAHPIDTPTIEAAVGRNPRLAFLPPSSPYIPADRDSPATPRPLAVSASTSRRHPSTLLDYARLPDGDESELEYDDSRFESAEQLPSIIMAKARAKEADPFSDAQAVQAPLAAASPAQASSSRMADSPAPSVDDDTFKVTSQLRKMSIQLEANEDLQKDVFDFPVTPMPLPTPMEAPAAGEFPGLKRTSTGSSAYSSATGLTTTTGGNSPGRPLSRPTFSKRASSYMSSSGSSGTPPRRRPTLDGHGRKMSSLSLGHGHRRSGDVTASELEKKMATVRRRIRSAAREIEGGSARQAGTSRTGLSLSRR